MRTNMSFGTFIVGPENQAAHDRARAFGRSGVGSASVLLLLGPAGSGKSHLLRATELELARTGAGLKVRAVSADMFGADYWLYEHDAMGQCFDAVVSDVDVLLIDDVQWLRPTDAARCDLGRVCAGVLSRGGRIFLAGREVPAVLHALFAGLAVEVGRVEIGGLAEEPRFRIIEAVGLRRGGHFSEGAKLLLAKRLEWSVGEMVFAALLLAQMAQASGGVVDLSMARKHIGMSSGKARGG